MFTLEERIFKYGYKNEVITHSFTTEKELKHYVNTRTQIEDEPQWEDFYDFDNPNESYNYHHSKWESNKDATKDDVKWYAQFYFNNEFLGGCVLDL